MAYYFTVTLNRYVHNSSHTDVPVSHEITARIFHNLKMQKTRADK